MIYDVKPALLCHGCGAKRTVALVTRLNSEWTRMQICLACAVEILESFKPGRSRPRRKEKHHEVR